MYCGLCVFPMYLSGLSASLDRSSEGGRFLIAIRFDFDQYCFLFPTTLFYSPSPDLSLVIFLALHLVENQFFLPLYRRYRHNLILRSSKTI